LKNSREEYEFNARKSDINNLISELKEALTIKNNVFKENKSWQHIDDLNYIREQLTNVVKYAKASLDKW
jgi:hypothetical protein